MIPAATILFFYLSTFIATTTVEQVSAFSTSFRHGCFDAIASSSSSPIDQRQQHRITSITTDKNHGGIGTINSRLFAEKSDSAVKAAEEATAIPTDPAKTTPQFLAGLWRLIAKGNDMVRGVSGTEDLASSL